MAAAALGEGQADPHQPWQVVGPAPLTMPTRRRRLLVLSAVIDDLEAFDALQQGPFVDHLVTEILGIEAMRCPAEPQLAAGLPAGNVTYRNSFVTDLAVDRSNIAELAACGRARWKIENETFNVLKTNGYHLEHNFGHGKENLSALLATLNLFAFACHGLCKTLETAWEKARDVLGSRQRFFEHLRTITSYLVFPSWSALVRTLRTGQPPPARASP